MNTINKSIFNFSQKYTFCMLLDEHVKWYHIISHKSLSPRLGQRRFGPKIAQCSWQISTSFPDLAHLRTQVTMMGQSLTFVGTELIFNLRFPLIELEVSMRIKDRSLRSEVPPLDSPIPGILDIGLYPNETSAQF